MLELHDELSRPVTDEALLLRQALRAGKGSDCLNGHGRCPILAAEMEEGPRADLEIFVDIVVGDVWIAAGQSQMALPYSAIAKQRRIYSDSLQRVRAYHDGRWIDAERPNALYQVSAAGLRAATLLAERLSYPIGLIDIPCPVAGWRTICLRILPRNIVRIATSFRLCPPKRISVPQNCSTPPVPARRDRLRE